MFKITAINECDCSLCGKSRPCFVTTCEKGTFDRQPVCAKCLERQVKMRQPHDEKPSLHQVG
jgi:hypothetical protein